MDENKNWINYKKFNPDHAFELCVYSNNTGSINYICEKVGMYILIGGGDNTPITQIQSSATTSAIWQNQYIGTRPMNCITFLANIGDDINITYTKQSYLGQYCLFYIGNRYSSVSLANHVETSNNNTSHQLSFSNLINRALFAIASGTSSFSVTLNSNIENAISNGTSFAGAAAIKEYGSASITARAGSSGGFVMILDLQLLE